jgi:hypothetical protein
MYVLLCSCMSDIKFFRERACVVISFEMIEVVLGPGLSLISFSGGVLVAALVGGGGGGSSTAKLNYNTAGGIKGDGDVKCWHGSYPLLVDSFVGGKRARERSSRQ